MVTKKIIIINLESSQNNYNFSLLTIETGAGRLIVLISHRNTKKKSIFNHICVSFFFVHTKQDQNQQKKNNNLIVLLNTERQQQ